MYFHTRILLAALAVFAGSCDAFDFIWGMNKELNDLCPNESGSSERGLKDPCEVRDFLMCYDGQAIAINTCADTERFNRKKNQCDFSEHVALPKECSGPTTQKKTCDQIGVNSAPVEGSCKYYYSCTAFGGIKMKCNNLSYYIAEMDRCMFITDPYVSQIPAAALKKCQDDDPYTKADFERNLHSWGEQNDPNKPLNRRNNRPLF